MQFKIVSLLSNQSSFFILDFDYTCGNQLHGYTVTEVENIPDIDAHVIQLIHNQTGAQHLHIARDDRNNTFRYFLVDSFSLAVHKFSIPCNIYFSVLDFVPLLLTALVYLIY